MSEKILEIRHLSKTFGANLVLKDIDFTVNSKDVTCIIGASGSGKSTLLRCLNLLETPTTGEILYHGNNIADAKVNAPKYRSRVGMVFQSFNLFNNMTVLENCMVGQVKVLKKGKEESKQKAMYYLEKVGMAPYINAKPRQLSGGQKQRVLIARALCATDKLLILDEPITGLDPSAILDFYQLIRKLNQEEKVAILMVSHDMANIVHQGGKILQMRQKPLFWGTMKEYVKSEIAHSFLGREELATLGHRCGVPMQKDGIRKMQKPEMGSEIDSETKQHLKDRNAEKEV